MNFQQSFLNSLKSNVALTKSISLMNYLPKTIKAASGIEENLPYVQAYGDIQSAYPYYYELADLDSYCLVYTENGAGILTMNNLSSLLLPGTLALINCKELHRIEIKQSSWKFKIFFIKGNTIPFLYETIEKNGIVITFPLGSAVPNMIQKLYLELDKSEESTLILSKFILDILFEVVLENNRLSEGNTTLPDYLIQIKERFDSSYQKSFSLELLEKEYHISRYRICREFTKYFETSPIQYLNHRRIAVAKEALLQTDKRINEIGQMVGFENTNHFIRLFKQQTGVTPLEFRKQPPAQNYFY